VVYPLPMHKEWGHPDDNVYSHNTNRDTKGAK